MGLGCLNPGRCKCSSCCNDYALDWEVDLSLFAINSAIANPAHRAANQLIVDDINSTAGAIDWDAATYDWGDYKLKVGKLLVFDVDVTAWGEDVFLNPFSYTIEEMWFYVYAGCKPGTDNRWWTWQIVAKTGIGGSGWAGVATPGTLGGGSLSVATDGSIPHPLPSQPLTSRAGKCGLPGSPWNSGSGLTQINTSAGLLSIFRNTQGRAEITAS